MYSKTLRSILLRYYGVRAGNHSYGPMLRPGFLERGTNIGNYCSFAAGIQVLRRNHPANRLSQHPLFFNKICGLLQMDSMHSVEENPLTIGNDVWIGMNVIICPGCRNIGNGSVIGAGSVVTKDVAPFTIVAGNPAKVIRKRFAPEVEEIVAASEWWLRPLDEIKPHLDFFTKDITPELLEEFARAFPPRPATSNSEKSGMIAP